MPSLQIISDFHLEFRRGTVEYDEFLKPCADVLGLLGDIGSPLKPNFESFIGWCSSNWSHVLYVAGNHEYYNSSGFTIEEINEKMTTIFAKFPNVTFLDNKTYVLDNIMFIGSVLWSHIPPDKDDFLSCCLNEFRVVYIAPRERLKPAHVREIFDNNKRFIEQSIAEARSRGLKAVVLTHHVPSFQDTSPPQFAGSDTKYGFATPFPMHHDPLAIRLWCCGHTHHNFHHRKEGYELLSNQVGYYEPVVGYNKELSIQL
jgi:predicted phosphohydrolase